ncbi:helix-turn-helix transcriptional regulator [Pedobacter gandavensis]|uniref:helix-turn-helix domain-containing protein n=1 Tax=Pedobacter TaxID=84567 RepID=UPI001C996132|nr:MULTISPECIES: helix-turn-helix transcriptional regulator [Pedobacter]WGQ10571.1 helix-turn-helix transcriptional regulator [Pedobacter gandavensis]
MSVILGIEKLKNQLDEQQLDLLEQAAEIHKQQSNITFCILVVEADSIQIETSQAENRSGKYAKEASLVKRTHEVFDKWLPKFDIQVIPATYMPSPTSVVNPKWLEQKMEEKGVRIKQIAFDTGVDRESIADWVSGKRSMSQIVKAMFYYYLSK